MIRPTQKVLAPPVPPRPSKTVVAEALAKSRKLSPVRVLYATQPVSSSELKDNDKVVKLSSDLTNNKFAGKLSSDLKENEKLNGKPVVPVRVAPPPPVVKPRLIQPNIVKSFSSAAVFSQNSEIPKVSRSISDCREEPNINKIRPVVFQSNKSRIEVNLSKKNSFKNGLTTVETKNEKNKENTEEKYCTNAEIKLSNNTLVINDKKDNIIQSHDKTMITVNAVDDDNNNNFNKIKEPEKTVVVIPSETIENEHDKKKVKFDDKINHETLIAELENMRKEQERLSKRQRKPFRDLYDTDDELNSRISHSDWVEVANGEEVRLSSCQIFINEDEFEDNNQSNNFRIPRNMSLHGLPPLPKSLSGFNLLDNGHRETRVPYRVPASPGPQTPSRASSSRGPTPPTPGSGTGHVVYPPHPRMNGSTGPRKPTNLDTQLAILRREMYGLRQLDLTLLSQLYSLNEAIQDFRQMLQDQEDNVFSPQSPSPSPSSGDEIDEFYSPQTIRFKPTGPLRRTSNSSSATSSEYGTV